MTVFDFIEEITLSPWQEALGWLLAIHFGLCSVELEFKTFTARILTNKTSLPLIRAELNKSLVGKRVAVLVTNIPERPVIVRVIEEEYVTPAPKEIRVTQSATTIGGVTDENTWIR